MSLAIILFALTLAAFIARVVYRCYFHPLARYPGPWFAHISNAWFVHI
jgi:benzoate 4-monooxygenase